MVNNLIEELWIQDQMGRPMKLTREVKDREEPYSLEAVDTYVHYEKPQPDNVVVNWKEQQQDQPQVQTVPIPEPRSHQLTDFERRVQRGNSKKPFSPRPFVPPVFSLRDEYGNQRTGINVLSPRFYSRRLFCPMYEEITQDEEGNVIEYKKHFYIPKYAKL